MGDELLESGRPLRRPTEGVIPAIHLDGAGKSLRSHDRGVRAAGCRARGLYSFGTVMTDTQRNSAPHAASRAASGAGRQDGAVRRL